jgi:hypothetical protein
MLEQINLLGAVSTLAYFSSTTLIFVLRARAVLQLVENIE